MRSEMRQGGETGGGARDGRARTEDVLAERWRERLFDPPGLGSLARCSASARAYDPRGRFVEIFVLVVGRRIRDVGYLTDLDEEAMACASMWRELWIGRTPGTARLLETGVVQATFPELPDGSLETLELCRRAGAAAMLAALDGQGAAGRLA